MAKGGEKSHEDIEKGVRIDNYVLSQHSAFDSEVAGVVESCKNSFTSDCSLEVDLESGVPEIPLNNPTKVVKNCRICHLRLEGTPESGIPIELDCCCKHDLVTAHKQCAETWFKIIGNKICGSMTKNDVCVTETTVVVGQPNETANTIAAPAPINWGSLFWSSLMKGLYFEMLSNFFYYFSRGDGVYLFAFFLFLFFVIVWHCVDCRRKEENPSITPQPQQAA